MIRLIKPVLLVFVVGVFAAVSRADTVLCTETDSGCVTTLPGTSITVASDGEAGFFPFDAGFDSSDGIQFPTSAWVPDPSFSAAFAPGFWTQVSDTNTWILPAITPCGIENEPSCEPVAKWDFSADGKWETPTVLDILDSDGVTLSDVIVLANDGPGGNATITFSSDPNVVPEPSLGLFTAVLCAALLIFRKRRTASDQR